MVHTLVVYAPEKSRCAVAAQRIGTLLKKRKYSVVIKEAASTSMPDLAAADIILFGSSVDSSRPARTFLHPDYGELARSLKGVNLAGRVVGLFSEEDKMLTTLAKALADTGVAPDKENHLKLAETTGADPAALNRWLGPLVKQLEILRER